MKNKKHCFIKIQKHKLNIIRSKQRCVKNKQFKIKKLVLLTLKLAKKNFWKYLNLKKKLTGKNKTGN